MKQIIVGLGAMGTGALILWGIWVAVRGLINHWFHLGSQSGAIACAAMFIGVWLVAGAAIVGNMILGAKGDSAFEVPFYSHSSQPEEKHDPIQ